MDDEEDSWPETKYYCLLCYIEIDSLKAADTTAMNCQLQSLRLP